MRAHHLSHLTCVMSHYILHLLPIRSLKNLSTSLHSTFLQATTNSAWVITTASLLPATSSQTNTYTDAHLSKGET